VIRCADDYGLSPSVDDGILELAALGRIDAVSVMVGFPDATGEIERLRAFGRTLAVGLHLVLTDHRAVATGRRLPSFRGLATAAALGTVDRRAVAEEIAAQWDRFCRLWGRAPAFVDGHQHVHQLAGVRGALVDVLSGKERPPGFWVRTAGLPPEAWACLARRRPEWLPRQIALAHGGRALRRRLAAAGLAHSRYLFGFYPEATVRAAEALELFWSLPRPPGTVFYCHPGYVDATLGERDPLTAVRTQQLRFLRERSL
jgi:predicted glycoside hydrolase/deacetylase ChbG (UPF0249 family)